MALAPSLALLGVPSAAIRARSSPGWSPASRPTATFGQGVVDVLDGLGDALAQVASLVAVAELDRLVGAGAGAGGDGGAAERPVGQDHVDLDGRVASAVEDLSAADGGDGGGVRAHGCVKAPGSGGPNDRRVRSRSGGEDDGRCDREEIRARRSPPLRVGWDEEVARVSMMRSGDRRAVRTQGVPVLEDADPNFHDGRAHGPGPREDPGPGPDALASHCGESVASSPRQSATRSDSIRLALLDLGDLDDRSGRHSPGPTRSAPAVQSAPIRITPTRPLEGPGAAAPGPLRYRRGARPA